MHAELTARGVAVPVRAVTDLLHRFDERRTPAAAGPGRRRPAFAAPVRVRRAIGGLQPDVGHEVRGVVRDGLSGRVVVAKARRSATGADRGGLRTRAAEAVGVAVAGVVSDGQPSVRNAVAAALPGGPTGGARSRTCGRPPDRFPKRIDMPRRS